MPQEMPGPGDWLAVLTGDREAVMAGVEVVAVYETEVEGFILFPDDGVPVRVPIERCLPFVKLKF